MLQSLIVALLLMSAVAYLGRRWYYTFAASRGRGGGGGCKGCSAAGD